MTENEMMFDSDWGFILERFYKNELFVKMKKIVTISDLSLCQFWHSLSLLNVERWATVNKVVVQMHPLSVFITVCLNMMHSQVQTYKTKVDVVKDIESLT